MQFMHDRIQGIVSWIVLLFIALSFSLWGIQNYFNTGINSTDVIAKINGKKITKRQFFIIYEKCKYEATLKNNYLLKLNNELIKHQALKLLVEYELIYQELTKLGFNFSNDQLWFIVANQLIFKADDHFSIDKFKYFVKRFFASERDFFLWLEKYLLYMNLKKVIIDTSFSLPTEKLSGNDISDPYIGENEYENYLNNLYSNANIKLYDKK